MLNFISWQKQMLVRWNCVSILSRDLFHNLSHNMSIPWLNYCTIPSISWNGWWLLMKYQNFPLSEFPFCAGWICFFIAHDICEGNGVVMVTSFIIGGKWNLEYHTFLWSGSLKSLGWIIRWEAHQLPLRNWNICIQWREQIMSAFEYK